MSTEPPSPAQQPIPDSDGPWRDRRVLLAVTGGIAGYKAASLTSLLVQQGAQVRVANGLMPPYERTPLNAQVSGRMEYDDYTVENVLLEALPGL